MVDRRMNMNKIWKKTCLPVLHTIAFTPFFHFHASFPTISSSISLSLVWGIWTPSKHGPWLRIFQHHIIWPLISFHHSFHLLTHVAFPPFTIPWPSLVIGSILSILSHIRLIHSFLSILSIHSYHIQSTSSTPFYQIHLFSNSFTFQFF